MKPIILLILLNLSSTAVCGQEPNERQRRAISAVIDQYSRARETRDTVLLRQILTDDIDQLVSSGEWRTGIQSAVEGMLVSSSNSPGRRALDIEKIRLISSTSALVDCKYEIQRADGTARRMWSTFIIVLSKKGAWKISGIRNMLPAPQ